MEEHFINILDENKETIYKICNFYAANHEDAKDIYQEVLLNIWKSLPQFNHKSSISTWVYRITLNICLRAKYKHDKKNKNIIHLDSVKLENFENSESSANNEGLIKQLYACIRKLNDPEKSIVLLYLEDLSYKEIAEICGISENLVAVKIKRIKSKLFTCIKS